MAVTAGDKGAPVIEHDEEGHLKSEEGIVRPVPSSEVTYGNRGMKAIFASPYVFGAALLASMGGFSYGYGTFHNTPLLAGLA